MKIRAFEDCDLRDGGEFVFSKKLTVQSPSTFIVVVGDEVIVTRRFSNISNLPDFYPVIAHWHGQYRTEGFLSTIGQLKKNAEKQGLDVQTKTRCVHLREIETEGKRTNAAPTKIMFDTIAFMVSNGGEAHPTYSDKWVTDGGDVIVDAAGNPVKKETIKGLIKRGLIAEKSSFVPRFERGYKLTESGEFWARKAVSDPDLVESEWASQNSRRVAMV